MACEWRGVFPAVTTEFHPDESLDLEATARNVERLIAAGVDGLIMLGTVGENTVLDPEEKRDVLRMAVEKTAGRVPVLAGVAETATRMAARFAVKARDLGVNGLMVLPAMVYKSDPAETSLHFRTVARATDLPIMVYNNPVSYGVDIRPEQFLELSNEPTLVCIKESSEDPRRLTDIATVAGDRYTLFCGVDDLVLESAMLGAVGWVSGLTNAFPEESVRLWQLAAAGRYAEALPLYRWFTPLLHLDTDPKLVQLIKFCQAHMGVGSETVRAPRRTLSTSEREHVQVLLKRALKSRPELPAMSGEAAE